MKGIYLTEEGKQEIEAKIAELEKNKYSKLRVDLEVYKEILSSATMIPVEETWGSLPIGTNECELLLPNGVIIEPKIIENYERKEVG
jgi:hypothetical protein